MFLAFPIASACKANTITGPVQFYVELQLLLLTKTSVAMHSEGELLYVKKGLSEKKEIVFNVIIGLFSSFQY